MSGAAGAAEGAAEGVVEGVAAGVVAGGDALDRRAALEAGADAGWRGAGAWSGWAWGVGCFGREDWCGCRAVA